MVRGPSPASVNVACKSIIDLHRVMLSMRLMEKTLEFLKILQQRITFRFCSKDTMSSLTFLFFCFTYIYRLDLYKPNLFIFNPKVLLIQEDLKFMRPFQQVSLCSVFFVQKNIANFSRNLTHIFRAINLPRKPVEYIP